jgi:Holliday junction resolvase RusA-like endonuclease
VIELVIPGPPQAWQRAGRSASGRFYTPDKTRQAESLVKLCALANRVKPLGGDLEMEVHYYLPTRRRVDADNLLKATLDGGNGCLYADDSQITRIVVEKHIDKSNPRTRIVLKRRGKASK